MRVQTRIFDAVPPIVMRHADCVKRFEEELVSKSGETGQSDNSKSCIIGYIAAFDGLQKALKDKL